MRKITVRVAKDGRKTKARAFHYDVNGSRFMFWHGWKAYLRRTIKNNRRADYFITYLSPVA